MKRLVEFPRENRTSVIVEVDEPELQAGLVRAARPGEIAEKAHQTFAEAIGRVRGAAEHLISDLRGIAPAPDRVEVEFGIKLSAEAGAFIASAATEANFKVTLRWSLSRSSAD